MEKIIFLWDGGSTYQVFKIFGNINYSQVMFERTHRYVLVTPWPSRWDPRRWIRPRSRWIHAGRLGWGANNDINGSDRVQWPWRSATMTSAAAARCSGHDGVWQWPQREHVLLLAWTTQTPLLFPRATVDHSYLCRLHCHPARPP